MDANDHNEIPLSGNSGQNSGQSNGTHEAANKPQNGPIPQPIPVYIPPVNQGGGAPKKSFLGGIVKTVMSSVIIFSLFLNVYLVVLIKARMMASSDYIYMPSDDVKSKDKIAIIPLGGETIDMNVAATIRGMFKKAAQDDDVKAVILRVNCPGGQVAPSNMINQYLQNFKKETGKKVYVSIQQLGASGAYWISAASDRIYAQENAMVGSIGVIAMNFIIENTLKEKLGVQPVIFKSSRSPFKDHNSPFRMPTEQEKEDMVKELDTVHTRFVKVIAQGRANLTEEEVWALADGDIHDGFEALENKLIDKIGFIEDVIADLKSELDIDPTVVVYAPVQSLKDRFLGSAFSLPKSQPWQKALEVTAQAGPMVIWPQGYYQNIVNN